MQGARSRVHGAGHKENTLRSVPQALRPHYWAEESIPAMTYIFGPVPSRRLGLSLGVDLTPYKTCTYDCLYCQLGKTTCKRAEPGPIVSIGEILEELQLRLQWVTPDFVTLSGSGEPTLHSQMDQVISRVKNLTGIKVAVLTNGSLLWRGEVRTRLVSADLVMPTLSTAFEETFRAIHRPHPDLHLPMIIEGMRHLRAEHRGELFLEVMLLAGLNDSDMEVEGLKRVIEEICPDRIQLNTVVRPPVDSRAMPLDRQRLEEIKNFFGSEAEIIADIPPGQKPQQIVSSAHAIMDMAQRRPVRAIDIANGLNLPMKEVEEILKGLVLRGSLRRREHLGEVYYSEAE